MQAVSQYHATGDVMQHMDYAFRNRAKYLDWACGINHTPYSPLDLTEWAILTAHCRFEVSVQAFEATREMGEDGIQALGDELKRQGVVGSHKKAGFIYTLREGLEDGTLTLPTTAEHRRTVKLPGLGYCKHSFAACLIDPFGADVVCMDTHMLQVYLGYRPDSKEVNRIYRKEADYTYYESIVILEAEDVGMPPFPYQWAVWDWKRAKYDNLPNENHSFLWPGGATQIQTRMKL